MHALLESPLVTVAVPTIGRAEYFQYAIRSILSQTYWNLQVLISDNAPSIPSAELLSNASIEDRRIEIVTRPIRLGFVEHMNLCIRDARGSYFMILSDDDQISSGYIEEMVWLMESNPSLSVSFGPQVMINEDNRGLIPAPMLDKQCRIVEGKDYIQLFFMGQLNREILTHFSFFTSTSLLREVGRFPFYPFGAHSDNLILVKLALRGNVGFGANQLYYRVYNASTGMSMPLKALLVATKQYTIDVRSCLIQAHLFTPATTSKLVRHLTLDNIRLILIRIKRMYLFRVHVMELATNFARLAHYTLSNLLR
jgi:glycosyltransferase involved in cell wall biosynthesis